MNKKTATLEIRISIFFIGILCIFMTRCAAPPQKGVLNEQTLLPLVYHHLRVNDQAAPCSNPVITGCYTEYGTLLGLIVYRYQIQGREGDVVVLQNVQTNACYVVDFDDYITHGKDETDDAKALSDFLCWIYIHHPYPDFAPSEDAMVEFILPSNYSKYAICPGIAVGNCSKYQDSTVRIRFTYE